MPPNHPILTPPPPFTPLLTNLTYHGLARPTGRLKEKSYDPYTGVSTLQAAWVSRASEKQRRGRAGRCQPGVAFHCYSRTRSQALAELQLPELKRSPLDELCLQVCLPHFESMMLHLSLLVWS